MTLQEIQVAIARAQLGIARYAAVMERFSQVDVTADADFQRLYNGFYRVQRRQQDWYGAYYALMQSLRNSAPAFAAVLNAIHAQTGRYEPSFASKLVATIDPRKPVWDIHVLANTGHAPPGYGRRDKMDLAKIAYASIERWYAAFLDSDEGKLCIGEFDRLVPLPQRFTALKKVDFILWQMR